MRLKYFIMLNLALSIYLRIFFLSGYEPIDVVKCKDGRGRWAQREQGKMYRYRRGKERLG